MRLVLSMCLLALPALAGEPVVGAGDAAADQADQATKSDSPADQPRAEPAKKAETTVIGERPWDEHLLVGPYQQPKWTDRRRFPGVRLYVAPPGTATFEGWLEVKTPFGADSRIRTLYEMSFGLGHHLQLDLYLRTESEGTNPMFIESERVELRWALADWGVIPGNPTLYFEWIRQTNGPNKGELKVLFGGELSPRLFWGLNLFFERELWGFDQAQEYGFTGGLAYSLRDSKLSLGGEVQVELVDTRTTRFNPLSVELLVGPSVSWRPVPSAHLLLVWYLGPELSRDDGAARFGATFVMQPTLVAGWRF